MKNKLATKPRLVTPVRGNWYVYFQVKDPLTNKMVPVKIYRGFNDYAALHERREYGEKLALELWDKMKLGWSPLDKKDDVIYSDQTEYANFADKFGNKRKSTRNTRFYMSLFLERRKVEVKPNTYKTYQSKMRIFCNWMDKEGYGGYDVSAVSNGIIKDFFLFIGGEKDLDRPTVEDYRRVLKGFFEYLKKQDKARENPVHDISLPVKKKDMAARPINKKDLAFLLNHIKDTDPQLFLACVFIYYLSIRPGQEMRLMKIRDIDTFNGVVVVTDDNSKKRRRAIDMPKHLIELCEEYLLHRYNGDFYVFGRRGKPGTEPTGKNTLRVRFNVVRDSLGMPDTYKFYSMKHTGGGNLLQSGATIEEIRNHMGHKSIETTDRYLRRHFGNRSAKVINDFPKPF